jgi:hypothetical protein
MEQIMKTRITVLALSLGLLIPPALADSNCTADKDTWRSIEELRRELTNKGWKIEEIEEDDGCYEVEGTNDSGARVEADFDPSTFEMIASEPDD